MLNIYRHAMNKFILSSLGFLTISGCSSGSAGQATPIPKTVVTQSTQPKSTLSTGTSKTLTVQDNLFSTPSLGSGFSSYRYAPSGTPWIFHGTAGISGNGSAFTGANPTAPNGAQVAFIQHTGSMSQVIQGFQANSRYALTFVAAARSGFGGGDPLTITLDYHQVIGTLDPGPIPIVILGHVVGYLNQKNYNMRLMTFRVPTSGAHSINFAGTPATSADQTEFLTNIQIIQY
jgi:hypothetical protein